MSTALALARAYYANESFSEAPGLIKIALALKGFFNTLSVFFLAISWREFVGKW